MPASNSHFLLRLLASVRRLLRHALPVCVLAGLCAAPAHAADWPAEPVHIVLGYPPGSGTDATARALADEMTNLLGVPTVVENKPGASGRIGTAHVAKSKPDGHTILFGTGAELTLAPSTVKALPYDPVQDFRPVMLLTRSIGMVVAAPDFPARDMSGLVAEAKKHPGAINYGSGGTYSIPHVLGLQFNLEAQIETTHIPYKGAGPMMVDLTSSRLQYAFSSPGAALSYVEAGKLRVLGIAAPKRLPALPDVPTLAEQGYPGFDNGTWFGLLVPAGTPDATVKKLHATLLRALESPGLSRVLGNLYISPVGSSPEEFSTFLRKEIDRYHALTQALGIQPE